MTELEAMKAQRDHLNEAVVRLCDAAKLATEQEQALRRELAQRDALIADLVVERDEAKKDYAAEKSKHARTEALRHEEQVRRKKAQEELQAAQNELTLRTESCERLLKENRELGTKLSHQSGAQEVEVTTLRTQLQAALAKSEQRREALLTINLEPLERAYDDGGGPHKWDQAKLIRAAISPDAPSAPTKEPERVGTSGLRMIELTPHDETDCDLDLYNEEKAELERERDKWKNDADTLAAELREAMASRAKVVEERDRLRAQLPEGMKHCFIIAKECSVGHAWLTAKNWIDFPCPTCAERTLQAENAKLREALQAAIDDLAPWYDEGKGRTEEARAIFEAARALGIKPGGA